MKSLVRAVSTLLCTALLSTVPPGSMAAGAAAHDHGGKSHGKAAASDLGTSAVIDKEGRIWAVTKQTAVDGQYVVLQSSTDMGQTWSSAKRIQKQPEPVAASGEARPHIALSSKGEIYITYTKPVARPHIGDIRFVRSIDGGETFSEPVTVHANRDVITHSFETLLVDPEGRIFVAWIDGRDAFLAKSRNERYAGSALYYAVSRDGGASFKGDYKVADHSCECCRVGMSLDADGAPVVMWRHIFEPNIRDHAMARLSVDGKPGPVQRVTYDDWHIDACPHHGPSIAFGADGRRHQVWFNGKEEGGGAFYAMTSASGVLAKPESLGAAQVSHPDVAVQGKQMAVVWKQFDGKSTAIMARVSDDGGNNWREQEIARTTANSDKPHLITSQSRIVLVWRTQNEGIRIFPVMQGKA
ncbi:sialidase family protein [Noviherbaspirillum sp. Root189]|uniref:sialidase family protein n=1 Tax=Noviherbaspirillum sp. Root189 TaxID=1736487 RepID=UPI0012E3958D|nr:sialidase family protein [Noviherbaspirillum sp. Root189]